jgi:hypothetical protein
MQGVGVGITALRRGAVLASVALRRRLLVTLEINNRDRAYDWFLAWLAHHQRTTRRPIWAHSHQLSVETVYAQHKNGSADVLFRLVAGPGMHWLKYHGAWMQVSWGFSTFHPRSLAHYIYIYIYIPISYVSFIHLGEARARDSRDADGVWYTMGNRHADDALTRPRAIPVAAR